MKQSFSSIRLTLLIIALVYFLSAYLHIFSPQTLEPVYSGTVIGSGSNAYLLMLTGTLFLTLGLGSIFAFFKPIENAGVIMMLIFANFAIFIVNIVMLAKGASVSWVYKIPETIYLALVTGLLIRYFPTALNAQQIQQSTDVVMDQFKKQLKDEKKAASVHEKELEKELKKAQAEADKAKEALSNEE